MYHEQHTIDGLPFDSLPRPRLPRVVTPGSEDGHHDTQFHSRDLEDLDQKVSQQFLAAARTDAPDAAVSAPELMYDGLPPLSGFSQGDLSMSPAAMFLSAFSPAASTAPLPDDEGEVVGGYTLGPIIGYGGFSTIRRAIAPSGGTVAVKIVRRADFSTHSNPDLARGRLATETEVWRTLTHEHILPLFDSVHTSYADFFFMLLCPAGSLYDILVRDGRPALPHDDAGMMFRQVVRGLRYLHEQAGIVHADMKLENVLVDESGTCRIADFGMARPIDQVHQSSSAKAAQPVRPHLSLKSPLPMHLSLLRHHGGARHRNSSPLPSAAQQQTMHAVYEFPSGSLPYAAPELLHPPSPSHPYRADPAQDIWALGVMLYALLTGRLPFVDSFEPRLTMKILHGAFEMPHDIGRGAELVLHGCLESSVARRWTITAVDEVGWSVGWGNTSEDSFTDEKEIEAMVYEVQQQSRSQSLRSTPRSVSPPHSPVLGSQHIQDFDTASSSAVMMSPPPLQSSTSLSQSKNPTHAGNNFPFPVRSDTSSPASSSNDFTSFFGSPPLSLERPRGRDHSKSRARASTRSPSPSVAPLTPVETRQGILFAPFSPPGEPRGRKNFRPFSDREPELDAVHESARWTLSPDSHNSNASPSRLNVPQSRSRGQRLEGHLVGGQTMIGRRAGSQPPPRSPSWAVPRSEAGVGVSPAMTMAKSTPGRDSGFLLQSGATPIAIPPSGIRSRSAGQTR